MARKPETVKHRANAEDAEIGRKVRACRLEARETQTELGDLLGVTFQQVQKYERGANRIPVTSLGKLADHYGKPITYFMSKPGAAATAADLIVDAVTAKLMAAFAKVKDAARRREIAGAVELMCDAASK